MGQKRTDDGSHDKKKKKRKSMEAADAAGAGDATAVVPALGKASKKTQAAATTGSELAGADSIGKKKSKKSKAEQAEQQHAAEPAEAPAAIAAAEGELTGKRKKSSKKKRKIAALIPQELAQLPQEEVARRERQRQLRELALKLRQQGKEYDPRKHRKHKPRRRVQLIIVPVFWNKRPGEKAAVLAAADSVQALLREAGCKCDQDTTTDKTPGQKYRHWEEKGVMLRIELGPKEADSGTCVLARCHTAGDVAEKTTLKVGPALVEAVAAALAGMGQQLAPPTPGAAVAAAVNGQQAGAGEGEGAAAGSRQQGKKQKQQAGQKAAGGGGGAQPQEQQAQPQAQQQQQEQEQQGEAEASGRPGEEQAVGQKQQKQQKRALPSAEELEGDFVGAALLGEQVPGTKGQKRAQQAAAAAAEVDAQLAAFAEEGREKEKKGRKKHKVVAF